jgi:hypothetical protein
MLRRRPDLATRNLTPQQPATRRPVVRFNSRRRKTSGNGDVMLLLTHPTNAESLRRPQVA